MLNYKINPYKNANVILSKVVKYYSQQNQGEAQTW